MSNSIFVFLLFAVSFSAYATESSSYAGQESRAIKALSTIEIDGYLQGKGMGLAKAAELNNYPGPRHVLDLSEELALTTEQRDQSQQLFLAMQSTSKQLGVRLIELEKNLDMLFSGGKANHTELEHMLLEIAKVKAQIRQSHLGAHIEQKKILSPEQISLYSQYRGYSSAPHDVDHSNHH